MHLDSRALQTLKGKAILPFVTYGYLKAVANSVPRGRSLLELGCGSGSVLFGERFRVTAVDLSFRSLTGTPVQYAHRVQADATKLEFPPESFEGIAASCFWEHLTVEQKAAMLVKFRRWLTPGGKVILLFDTASQSPLSGGSAEIRDCTSSASWITTVMSDWRRSGKPRSFPAGGSRRAAAPV